MQVSMKNCLIILTSNLGSADGERSNIGFGDPDKLGEIEAFHDPSGPEADDELEDY